jgi:hypothetical protein
MKSAIGENETSFMWKVIKQGSETVEEMWSELTGTRMEFEQLLSILGIDRVVKKVPTGMAGAEAFHDEVVLTKREK